MTGKGWRRLLCVGGSLADEGAAKREGRTGGRDRPDESASRGQL
jgi:hypothetical protein